MSRRVSGRRILLSEDDQEMRSLIAWTLHNAGYHVTECQSGFELIQRLQAVQNKLLYQHYDLLISDICLPGLNAFKVLEELKFCGRCPPIILLTSFGDDKTHIRARRMGVSALLDKPFALDDLLNTVLKLIADAKEPLSEGAITGDTASLDPHPD